MEFKNTETVSTDTKRQLLSVHDLWLRRLGDSLVGVYLHGSLALGCFREGVSDLDLLIVTDRPIPPAERQEIARDMLDADRKPCHLELSALCQDALHPWKHPALCQFHYSELWTERYLARLRDPAAECWILDHDFEDPDIACHVKLTRQCGITLYGRPIDEVFPEVPERDFWDSLRCDIDEYDFHAYAPRYFASNILLLGRILSYKAVGRILSKYEAGLWAAENVPARLRYIIEDALRCWYEQKEPDSFPQRDLDALRSFLIGEIKKYA